MSTTRMGRITKAVREFEGQRTTDGKPYVSELREITGIDDITAEERDKVYRRVKVVQSLTGSQS